MHLSIGFSKPFLTTGCIVVNYCIHNAQYSLFVEQETIEITLKNSTINIERAALNGQIKITTGFDMYSHIQPHDVLCIFLFQGSYPSFPVKKQISLCSYFLKYEQSK